MRFQIRTRRWTLWCLLVMIVTHTIDAHGEETIVFFRHAEKPSGGYGQLTCQGLNRALALLPAEFREVIVLRELEELSYKEISTVAGIPVGTVMSRLSRARNLLLQHLNATKE